MEGAFARYDPSPPNPAPSGNRPQVKPKDGGDLSRPCARPPRSRRSFSWNGSCWTDVQCVRAPCPRSHGNEEFRNALDRVRLSIGLDPCPGKQRKKQTNFFFGWLQLGSVPERNAHQSALKESCTNMPCQYSVTAFWPMGKTIKRGKRGRAMRNQTNETRKQKQQQNKRGRVQAERKTRL